MHFIFFRQPTKGHNSKSYGRPLFQYTGYIQSLSMLIQAFSFLAFIVPWKSVMKIFKNGVIWKPIKEYNFKSYGLLATFLPLHLPYLRDQVWCKFQWCRTTNISYWKPSNRQNSQELWTLGPYPVYAIHPVIVHTDISFQLSSFHSSLEIGYKNFQEWQNLKSYQGT